MILLVTSILAITLRAGTSLVYATIGEIYTERSGILNLGIEGMMLMGAVTAFSVSYHSGNLLLAVFAAMSVGAVLAALHAFLSITMRANQVVSGLSITIFGSGFASFLGQRLGPESNGYYLAGLVAPRFHSIAIPGLSRLPIIGAVFDQDLLTYVVFLLIPVAWFFLYKTRYGLNLRAVGENPQTADAMGVNVSKIRYVYTILGGMLVGLGGAHLSLSYTPGWTENITGGRGWIVIALVIFSMWNPGRAILGAIIFGGINAVQFRLQASGTTIPAAYLNMAPYLATVIVLVIMTWWETHNRKVGSPAALGVSYMREDK
ncbi:ABC transporter permease [Sediminispirochaeta smaragdinae]|jgi:simple sugar transport system permease protein|uniref:Inner-membrane translocator n=1 Tax=Sediminispirochaeta smaragdinae (strain DSM 11293 / JCM 15392 / SEBR 4228) TaxID=573413 RepID=E1R8W3_SEDSS|nr:ABC transporter permease [Sediminispirochaeta smaragdinae]ADK81870.1 inner-membrane translocator [Sediminispirochaeta smaragdinae DSM 11293]